MKKVAKRILMTLAIVILSLLLLVGATLAMALPGLAETTSLEIHSVDLIRIPDGTYTGSYTSFRWTTTVQVTVKDHSIAEINAVKTQSGRDSLVKDLSAEVIEEQTNDVDVVSGATASSNAFLKALEIALTEGVSNDPS